MRDTPFSSSSSRPCTYANGVLVLETHSSTKKSLKALFPEDASVARALAELDADGG